MAKKKKSFEDKLKIVTDYIGNDFLELARELREVQETNPDIFITLAKIAGLSPRKAYALTRISRQFDDLRIPDERLRVIGWTKLQIIGRYLTNENAKHLLQLAQQNTVHDLESRLSGETPVKDARVLVLYFSPEDYERLKAKLIEHGAIPNGSGLLKKEAALLALIEQH